jgi:four helix bundle protein
MTAYKRFEQLPVWQAAAVLFEHCDNFLHRAPPRVRGSFRDQLERAVLSVSSNIAEGFERGTTAELLSFLYISRGSAGEVRSMLTLLARRPWISGFEDELSELISRAESCSRQLSAWAESLQNSAIPGVRHLNDASRKTWQGQQRRKEAERRFDDAQRQQVINLPRNHPLRMQWEQKHGPLE